MMRNHSSTSSAKEILIGSPRRIGHELSGSHNHCAPMSALQTGVGNRALTQLLRQTIGKTAPEGASINTAMQEFFRFDPGQPIEPSTRREMESRFSCDFQTVRIHTSPNAAVSAK